MRMLCTILMFICFSAVAHQFDNPPPELSNGYWCQLHWVPPVERVNGAPLTIEEIQTFDIEVKLADVWVPWLNGVTNTTEHILWYSSEPCPAPPYLSYRARTVDTDGRPSDWASPSAPPKPLSTEVCQ